MNHYKKLLNTLDKTNDQWNYHIMMITILFMIDDLDISFEKVGEYYCLSIDSVKRIYKDAKMLYQRKEEL